MRKLFGTDGVRGVANVEPITVETAMKLGRAAAHIFKHKEGRHRIVIGKDTRLSCYMIESALTSGICSLGVDVILVGPLPTPAVAFMARSLRVDAATSAPEVKRRTALKIADIEEKIQSLQEMKTALVSLDQRCKGAESESTCPILESFGRFGISGSCCQESESS